MSTQTLKQLVAAALVSLFTGGVAHAGTQQQQAPSKKVRGYVPFKPAWRSMATPSDNAQHQMAVRVFEPVAGLVHHNGAAGQEEIILGGFEAQPRGELGGSPTVKIFQPQTQRYQRVFLPSEITQTSAGGYNDVPVLYHGMGAVGGTLYLAGGTTRRDGSTDALNPQAKFFAVNARTKKVTELPGLKYPRTAPLIGALGAGRVIVAGGMKDLRTGESNIEIFDHAKGAFLTEAQLDTEYPGLREGPAGRIGGKIVHVKEAGVERIFLIGGSKGGQFGFGSPLFTGSTPTPDVDVYDRATGKWTTIHLPTPTMLPGVDVLKHSDGRQEIVVAGGKTGRDVERRDPQLYGVEKLDPVTLKWTFGDHLPAQPALSSGGNATAEMAGNVLLFRKGRLGAQGGHATDKAYVFGFSKAYETVQPSELEQHGARPMQITINETEINNVSIDARKTYNTYDTSISNTQVDNNQTHVRVENNETRVKVENTDQRQKGLFNFGLFGK